MAYTQADLNNVQQAILDLSTGNRVVHVQFGGGNRVEYGIASLEDLKKLESSISSEVNRATRRRVRYFRTSKGIL